MYRRADPQPTWTTPFLFTLSGTFGPAGQPKSTAAFLADVTIGANIDPSTAEVLIFGLGEAEGWLLFVAGSGDVGGAAGSLAILTDLGIPGLLEIEGTALLQFNSFASARSIEIPRVGGPSSFVSVEQGFFVRIAGLDGDDPNSRARLSIFPADGRPVHSRRHCVWHVQRQPLGRRVGVGPRGR